MKAGSVGACAGGAVERRSALGIADRPERQRAGGALEPLEAGAPTAAPPHAPSSTSPAATATAQPTSSGPGSGRSRTPQADVEQPAAQLTQLTRWTVRGLAHARRRVEGDEVVLPR